MTTKHLNPHDRPAKWRRPVLLLAFALALASFACVPNEDTFKKDNPPPASFGTDAAGIDLVVTIRGVAHDPTAGTWVFYTVTNNGTKSAGTFDVDLYANLGSTPVIGTDVAADFDTITSLAPSESKNGAQKINGYDNHDGTAYAVADSLEMVSESNESNNVTSGFAWGEVKDALDEVDFESGQPSTISSRNTQDSSNSDYNWGFDTSGGADSTATSAISGPIADGFSSCLDYTPGVTSSRIAFFRMLSTEGNQADVLEFSLDGTAIFDWWGEVSWDYFSYTFPSGNHDFSFCYVKNASGSAGLDAVWVDQLEVQ